MYGINEHFESPQDNNMTIWRYMNLEKLKWMIRDKALYFCNSEQFEGSTTPLNKIIRDITYDDKLKELKTKSLNIYRKMIHINCWHINENESKGMWDLYTKNKLGVAIKSTYGNLKQAIEEDKRLTYISKVYYLDYEKAYIPEGCLFYEFLCKRGSYMHEEELRALFLKGYDANKFSDNDIRGTNVITDLTKLIDKVIVCPDASDEFVAEVKSEIKKYGFEFEVIKSELDKQPIF